MYHHSVPRADPAFVGLEFYTIFMALFTKKNTKLRIQIIYIYNESTLQQIANFKKADEYDKHQKIQKNNIIF
jgi:hypothetical protein